MGAVTLPTGEALEEMLEVAKEVALRSGDLIRGAHSRARTETHKGHSHNLVTETDHQSEELIVAALQEQFPDHAVKGEEGRASEGTGVIWYVDPLDGTNNFAHGYPMFSVSLAAVLGLEVLVGVTYDPLRDELFTARRGGGTALNGVPMEVSTRATLGESIVATGFPYDKQTNPNNNLPQFAAVTPFVRGVRRSGSAALDLAYVASGRLDAYWERGTAAWDVAAGVLMVIEAGGRVTDYDGGPPIVDGGSFVASNGLIHEAMLERLRCAAAN